MAVFAGAPVNPWISQLPTAGQAIAPQIQQAAQAAGVDPALFAAMVWTESDFNAYAVSPAGARGYTQLMPDTAAGLGVNPNNPLQNLQGGATYFAQQIAAFGSVEDALAAYNAGPHGDFANPETRAYIAKVMERYRLLGGASPTPSMRTPTSGQEAFGKFFDRMLVKKQAEAGVTPKPEAPVAPESVAPIAEDGGLRDIGLADSQAGWADVPNITDAEAADLDRFRPDPQTQQDALQTAQARGGEAWTYVPQWDGDAYQQALDEGLHSNAARVQAIARTFGFDGQIFGVGSRPNASDHPHGNAVDLMVGTGNPLGDTIAGFYVQFAEALGIKYVIWNERIWTPSRGWHAYTHPNGGTDDTSAHRNHVHVSTFGDA